MFAKWLTSIPRSNVLLQSKFGSHSFTSSKTLTGKGGNSSRNEWISMFLELTKFMQHPLTSAPPLISSFTPERKRCMKTPHNQNDTQFVKMEAKEFHEAQLTIQASSPHCRRITSYYVESSFHELLLRYIPLQSQLWLKWCWPCWWPVCLPVWLRLCSCCLLHSNATSSSNPCS